MREILFRGFHPNEDGNEKVFVNGEWITGTWVYGYPYPAVGLDKGKWLITEINIGFQGSHTYDVIPETVGHYTGLTDKNGKKIFEGDIAIFDNSSYNIYCEPLKGKIIWRNGSLSLKCFMYGSPSYRFLCSDDFFVKNSK